MISNILQEVAFSMEVDETEKEKEKQTENVNEQQAEKEKEKQAENEEKQDDIEKRTEEAGRETKNDEEEVHAKIDDPNEQMKDKEADKQKVKDGNEKEKTTKRKSPEDMTPPTFSLGLTPEESEPTEKEKEKQVEKRAKGLSPLESEPKPTDKEEKPVKRAKRPSRFLVSPYLNKKTAIKGKATTDEMMMTEYLFSMEGQELDFVSETKDGAATIRDYMQTLAPQLKVKSNVIDTFSLILNHEHKMNSKGKRTKYYFHTTMITKDMFKWKKANGKYDEKKQLEAFSKTIKSEFEKDPEMKNMKDLEMQRLFSMHLEKVKHPRAKNVLNKKPTIIRPKWGTTENDTDCGIFLMMHMEHYKGETEKN
ncbi:ulp1 protease family, C-terminal catalytic domain-containing protein [Tanacetum coccineum]